MKLNHRPQREFRTPSHEALGLEATQPQPESFDPRVDFPASELSRLKELARKARQESVSSEEVNTLADAWWLVLVDREFKMLVESNQGLEDALLTEFSAYYTKQDQKDRYKNKIPTLSTGLRAIRLFPNLRGQIQRSLLNSRLPELLKVIHPAPGFATAIFYLATMLEIYPEERSGWLKAYSVDPATVVERLRARLTTDPDYPQLVASTLLVFPELRSQILSPDLPVGKWKKDFQREPPLSMWKKNVAFSLTVIGAEDARIDETGQIQLQLKPRTAVKALRPLPDRPLE